MNAAALTSNKWVRRAGVTIVSVLALWAFLWLAVPPIAKSQLQKIASEKLGRQVTVGKIDFKPWTLELTLDDLRVAGADGAAPQVDIGRIYVDAELQSIVRLGPVIDALRIERPSFRLARKADGSFDFDDIVKRLTPAPDPAKPPGKPARFAIYNIAISGGSVDFDDQTVQRKHELRELVLNVPFISDLESKREITVEPKLAFVLNGSRFDSSAQATPFAQARKADAKIAFTGLDLVPYLGYIPAGQPARLLAGSLDADLDIDFQQAQTDGLRISGTLQVHNAKLADAQGRDLLGFESLRIALADVRPLERFVHLGEIELKAPDLVVARDAQGGLNLVAKDPATGAVQEAPAKAVETPEPAAPAAPDTAPAFRLQVDKVLLDGGRIGWHDQSIQPAATVEASGLHVEAGDIAWPMDKPATFSGSTRLGGARLQFKGEGTDQAANVQVETSGLPLSLAAPYLAQSLEPTLDGKLSGQLAVAWKKPDLLIKASQVTAEDLALTQGKTALASLGRFELTNAEVDLTGHTLSIEKLSASQPKVSVERDSAKRWMYERWLKTGDGAQAKAAAPKAAKPPPADANAKPWKLAIGAVAVEGGSIAYVDKAAGKAPVTADISALELSTGKIELGGKAPMALKVSGRIDTGRRSQPGQFAYQGQIGLAPLAVGGKVTLKSLPVHAFKAYFEDRTPNIDLRRFYLNYSGSVDYRAQADGPRVSVAGDTSADDVRVNSALSLPGNSGTDKLGRANNQLLRWKTLDMRGVKFSMAGKEPFRLDVRATTLTDFFARLVIDATGQLRLQDYTKAQRVVPEAPGDEASTRKAAGGGTVTTSREPVTQAANGAAAPAAAPAGGPPAPPAEAQVGAAPAAPAAAVAPPPQDTGPKPVMNFGPLKLVNGTVDFSDLFIRPNYSADVSELNGSLSTLSTDTPDGKPQLAELALTGKVQQTAALEVNGKLNPLVKPLVLDVVAKMHDLELAPLSPYSGRYTGYGIEQGKMSVDVNYKVAPDGQLTATNKLVLNQLRFTEEKVAGAQQTLPVRLAVALLADSDGVIDVDLPLSGSINDPQFSIGPLIWKAIGNLIVKAVAAPFKLLTGGLGGGSSESSGVPFDAGSAALTESTQASLDKVVKALTDRPQLRMTVIGTASLEKEGTAYQHQRLRELTQAEKRRVALRAGKDAADVAPVTDAEYPALLEDVYKRADIEKPRNFVGMAKGIPQKDMEELLMKQIQVTDETMRQLAIARGVAVRDYLLSKDLKSERLFLGAPQIKPTDAQWKPSAELKLDMR